MNLTDSINGIFEDTNRFLTEKERVMAMEESLIITSARLLELVNLDVGNQLRAPDLKQIMQKAIMHQRTVTPPTGGKRQRGYNQKKMRSAFIRRPDFDAIWAEIQEARKAEKEARQATFAAAAERQPWNVSANKKVFKDIDERISYMDVALRILDIALECENYQLEGIATEGDECDEFYISLEYLTNRLIVRDYLLSGYEPEQKQVKTIILSAVGIIPRRQPGTIIGNSYGYVIKELADLDKWPADVVEKYGVWLSGEEES